MASPAPSIPALFRWSAGRPVWLPLGDAQSHLWTVEPLVASALLAIGLVAHAVNMFNQPGATVFGDEGIYTGQAWSVLREGRLSPYTYFYDHAPAGWLLLALWNWVTGGPLAFGLAVYSGRALMLVLHLSSTLLLYHVARKLGCSVPTAAMAAVLFSVSPLAVFYQRAVLLDNIMVFWLLCSLDLLLDGWGRLSRVALSGFCFGVACLTKETAAFLSPAMLYLVVQQRWSHQGRFALSAWILPTIIVVSWYPLYASLKNELLPAGQAVSLFMLNIDFGVHFGSHVSLIEALRWQATRSGGGLFDLNNQFWSLVRTDWIPRDALLTVAGVSATTVNLLRGRWDRRALAAGLLGALPLLYLGRGGIVLHFYILFAIPFLCLNVALATGWLMSRLPRRFATPALIGLMATTATGYAHAGLDRSLYEEQASRPAAEAIAWIKRHLPADSKIVIDDYAWTDLHEPGLGGPAFPHAHSHWKVAADPAIRGDVFRDDWRNVDYLLIHPELRPLFMETSNTVAIEALENAHLARRWVSGSTSVELWKVDGAGSTEAMLLEDSARFIAARFERSGALVRHDGTVTSESQAYALLRAVWSGDRPGFTRVWEWTRANLTNSEGLLGWLWKDGALVDANSATDADTDAALALLLAARRWGDPALEEEGRRMVERIWDHEVTTVAGRPHLTAGDWAVDRPVIAFNPSYFAPYAYRLFQEVDPGHNWVAVIDSGYETLFSATAHPLGRAQSAGLPPDWVGIDRTTGELLPFEISEADTSGYGFDAARTYWRVALDLRWAGDGRAAAYLDLAGFLRDEIQRKGFVSGVYARDGAILQEWPSMVSSAGALAALLQLDPPWAHSLYATQIVGAASRSPTGVSWDDPSDLYAQEWGWFAVALYSDRLPNVFVHAQPHGSSPGEER